MAQIKRIAKGKIPDNGTDKEIENITKQVDNQFNNMTGKLNGYNFRHTTPLRSIDVNTATIGDVVNLIGTLISDLKEALK